MVRRRTRALIELGVSTLSLLATAYSWKYLWDNGEKWDDPIPASLVGLVAGAIHNVVFHWMYDHDVAEMRSSRRRGFLAGTLFVAIHALARRVAADSEAFEYNYNTGMLVGTIGYRLWYGLLYPLPGDD